MASSTGWQRTRNSWVVTAGVVVVGLVALQFYRSSATTPYPLADMHASANVTVPDRAHAQQAADRLVGEGKLMVSDSERRKVLVQVSFLGAGRRGESDRLVLFLIDNRTHSVATIGSAVTATGYDAVALGWDGRYGRLVKKYDWLRPLAELETNGGFTAPGQAVSFSPGLEGPISFVASLDDGALPVTDPGRDLTLALAYVGDERGEWALRVPITS